MTDEEDESSEILDEFFMEFEPMDSKPKQHLYDDLQEFLDFLGFTPGGLFSCTHIFPWVFGQLEDPEWLSRTDLEGNRHIMHTEPGEIFCYIDTVLLKARTGHHKDEYVFAIKALVKDKICYFPLAIHKMTDEAKCEFKNLFREAQTEEI